MSDGADTGRAPQDGVTLDGEGLTGPQLMFTTQAMHPDTMGTTEDIGLDIILILTDIATAVPPAISMVVASIQILRVVFRLVESPIHIACAIQAMGYGIK